MRKLLIILILSIFLFSNLSTSVFAVSSNMWTNPKEIISNANNMTDYDVAVDKNGNWHVVYNLFINSHSHIFYKNSTTLRALASGGTYLQGSQVDKPRISIDSSGIIHISYVRSGPGSNWAPDCSIFQVTKNKNGWTTAQEIIPNINNMTNYDFTVDNHGQWQVVYNRFIYNNSNIIKN